METQKTHSVKVKNGGKIHRIIKAYKENKSAFEKSIKNGEFLDKLKSAKPIESFSDLQKGTVR